MKKIEILIDDNGAITVDGKPCADTQECMAAVAGSIGGGDMTTAGEGAETPAQEGAEPTVEESTGNAVQDTANNGAPADEEDPTPGSELKKFFQRR